MDLYEPLLQEMQKREIRIESHSSGDHTWTVVTATEPKVRIRTDRFDALVLVEAYVHPYGLKEDWYNYLRAHEACGLQPEILADVVVAILAEHAKGTRPSRLRSEA